MNQALSIHPEDARASHDPWSLLRRWSPWIAGGAVALLGLTRRSPSGLIMAAAGGTLAYAGVQAATRQRKLEAHSSVLINCSPQDAYRLWHNFEDLPLFMHHLDSVKQTGDRRYRWIALGPMGTRIHWDAEIVHDHENESISWHSLPGSDITVAGFVEFRTAPAHRGTFLRAFIQYRPPAGALGHALAKILGKDLNFLMRQDLRRFKALMETGEIPTTEGQSHGPRSATAAVARVLDPDQAIRRQARIVEAFSAKRRIA